MKRMLLVKPNSSYMTVGSWMELNGHTRVMIIGMPAG